MLTDPHLAMSFVLSARHSCFNSQPARVGRPAMSPKSPLDLRDLCTVLSVAATVAIAIALPGIFIARRSRNPKDARHALDPKEHQIRQAVQKFMQPQEYPHGPLVERPVEKVIRDRIKKWSYGPTLLSGPYGSGKTWARQHALNGVRSVFVFNGLVRGENWLEEFYRELGVDGYWILHTTLRRVRDELLKHPDNLTKVQRLILHFSV